MVIILVGLLLVLFIWWSRSGRRPPAGAAELRLQETCSIGSDTGHGNLIGIQPYMTPDDYASEARFFTKLDGYLADAKRRGFIADKTIVVFPEYLGAWLVAVGEKQSVYRAPTVDRAAALLAASNLLSFLRQLPSADAPQRARCALFKMKAGPMARIYHRVFSRLAQTYRVTIVAGSIVLPDPKVRDGALIAGRGPLYNTSIVYAPDGRALSPLVKKAFPVADELGYLRAGRADDLPVFDTPSGRLAVLICADSWYPQSYDAVGSQRPDIIAVPAFVYPAGQWEARWTGYSGAAPPSDVDPADLASLTESDAWMKYGLPARISQSGARAGITVFLRGRFWDLGSAGQAFAVVGDSTHTCPRTDGAALLNLWLPPP
jgi:predicted amidohydrolase